MKVKVWRMTDNAVLPVRMTEGAAGFDVCASKRCIFDVGDLQIVPTDLVVSPQKGYHTELVLRSSLIKRGFILANSIGIIDEDYSSESDLVGVALYKIGPELGEIKRHTGRSISVSTTTGHFSKTIIERGERIAQLLFRKTIVPEIEDMTGKPNSNKVRNGWGSSGRK